MPRISWPLRSLYSLKMMSRSASRTRWSSTCLAVCAAMRPKVLRACFMSSTVAELFVLLRARSGVARVPEHLEAELFADLRFEAVLDRDVEGDLAFGLRDLFDDGHVLEEIDVAALFVEPGLELTGRTERACAAFKMAASIVSMSTFLSMPFSWATCSTIVPRSMPKPAAAAACAAICHLLRCGDWAFLGLSEVRCSDRLAEARAPVPFFHSKRMRAL